MSNLGKFNSGTIPASALLKSKTGTKHGNKRNKETIVLYNPTYDCPCNVFEETNEPSIDIDPTKLYLNESNKRPEITWNANTTK